MPMKSLPAVDRQKAYVASLQEQHFKFGLTVGTAFVRGIRDIGYKHTGTALDELIDNAYEAGASNVHVALNDDGTGRKNNATQIAVVDDGCGMIPEMIRVSMLWGGTDRENSRTGMGRFGYGLPSSCVSQGRRFEVYSVAEGGKLQMCVMDLDEIEAGKYTNGDGEIIMPEAQPATLPRFVEDYVEANLPDGKFTHGTVVVIDKLDKLTWKSINPLSDNLMEHFGVVYHKLLAEFTLSVNGRPVQPIDPLFLTSGYRWYDLDADRAQALDPSRIEVKDKETRAVVGRITVRFSYMPPSFASIDKTKGAVGKNANARFRVLKEYNGFIIARMGRIIEVVRHYDTTTFMNNDRYIKIEIDFDASLDEYFNVPTSKQRVDVADRVWEILKESGLLRALTQLRQKFKQAKAVLEGEHDKGDTEKRPSEQAMAEVEKLSAVVPMPVAQRQAERGRKRLAQEAEKRAVETGTTPEQAQREIEAELAGKPYKVAKRSIPGGAFFEVEQIGGTKVLWLNTSSRFFQEVHSGPASTPAVRAALEILLFSIGDRAMEGREELQAFYAHEIPEWSRKLEYALAYLEQTVVGQQEEPEPSEAVA
jgi:Histidine kinase-, DNA gyrase B-, and HSP90-like ATPase